MCPLKILEYYGPYKYWDFPRIGKWTPQSPPIFAQNNFQMGDPYEIFFNLDDFIVKFIFFLQNDDFIG